MEAASLQRLCILNRDALLPQLVEDVDQKSQDHQTQQGTVYGDHWIVITVRRHRLMIAHILPMIWHRIWI